MYQVKHNMKEDIYVLGTGLSHDGSACLLKNGKICVAIEKERITREKHDGLNDTAAINYCLEAEGITLDDLTLVVQNANFGFFEFGNSFFCGKRLFDSNFKAPIVTISHHLAHAYYAMGTCPYEEAAILVMDGCGSLYDECIDLAGACVSPQQIPQDLQHLYAEKDSLYLFKDNRLKTVYKDFSPFGLALKMYPMHPNTTKHSIGGLYSAATTYCFQDDSDAGKLMGLAPYGRPGKYNDTIFELKDGRVSVNYDWMRNFNAPARSFAEFWDNFQYYADIAYWVQKEAEKAIAYVIQSRSKLVDCRNLCYTGGVALNAVANGKILHSGAFDNYYFTPAAGDNGLAIGCAYYGWLEVLKKERVAHDGRSSFGKKYTNVQVKQELQNFVVKDTRSGNAFLKLFFENISHFINKNTIDERKYLIRFVIPEAGVYNLAIRNGGADLVHGEQTNPACTLITDTETLISGLIDKSHLIESIRSNRSSLKGDIQYFMKAVNFDNLSGFVRKLANGNGAFRHACFTEEKNVVRKTAELLAAGKVIGWFQGGCEFGPRALGNRSILADPRKAGVQDFINHKIKFREDFRPFAPSVLQEEVSNYFEFTGNSPYMILTAQVKEAWKNELKGILHIDNSARIQTVTRDINERYYELLQEFKSLTGLPILLNTSFNKKGMPIVETPTQALSYFFECALDCLVIGDFIVYK